MKTVMDAMAECLAGMPNSEVSPSARRKIEACLTAALSASPAGVGVETKGPWRSMDSAPKDGKHSIFAIKFGPFVYSIQGTWDAHRQKWINAADREGEYLAWMPNVKLPNEFCPWTDEYKFRAALTKEATHD